MWEPMYPGDTREDAVPNAVSTIREWSDTPAGVVAAGAPIIEGVDRLERDFVPLLGKGRGGR